MPSYVVVGSSRGLGYAFLKNVATDPRNTVIAAVRTPGPVIEKVKQDGLSNVTVVEADLTDLKSLQNAAARTSQVTGGTLDYLIINGVYYAFGGINRFLDDYDKDPEILQRHLDLGWKTNVVGSIHTINAFLPLLKRGSVKKVVCLSTGMADLELVVKLEIWEDPTYAINKTALNAVVAKYAARYGKEGILFLALSPGLVDTGHVDLSHTELPQKFMKLAPDFKGPTSPDEAAAQCMSVVDESSVQNGRSGAFISHLGNKQWI